MNQLQLEYMIDRPNLSFPIPVSRGIDRYLPSATYTTYFEFYFLSPVGALPKE